MAAAAETTLHRSRRRGRLWGRTLRRSVPYGLILPVLVTIGVILGYPLYWLVKLSTERYGLFELIRHVGVSVGLANYRSVLHDSIFWRTLLRTVVFTAVNVSMTIVLGMLVALLLVRVSAFVRVLLSSGLVLVWSMPVVVAVQIWYWMTNFQNGVVNYVLTKLHVGNFFQHDWYATTFSQLSLVTLLIVWGALPFVVITLYAGLALVVVMVFPVFWLISTALKSVDEIVSLSPTWFPLRPTLAPFRDAIHRPFFWEDVRNSLIVVTVTVAISIVLAFLAAIALAR